MNPEIEIETSAAARVLPATLKPLEKLAWNYWWSWAADGSEIFRDLDSALWQQCELNPRALLAQVSDLRFAQMAADPSFAERLQKLSDRFDSYMSDARPWPGLRTSAKVSRETPVAYFCAEYGVHSSLPLYSGGLGILAGDHLKSASDLNLPLVAVGLFYRFGYFRQSVTTDDWQDESYKEVYGDELPLELVKRDGAPVLVEVTLRGRTVRACAWRANIGRVRLYLLDTNLSENNEIDRLITGHLYGGDRETRLVQEMMLGIGGVRLLRALNLKPSVFHLNEGHSAFLSLELSRELIEQEQISFREAAARVRERCVFTTHTPVAAGHDEFGAELIKQGFGNWYETALGLSLEDFLALGRANGDAGDAFGLTPLALRMSRSTNGVSRRHGEVSRELWHKMWPERIVSEVPITSVTNGVHASTWVASPLRAIYEKLFGEERSEMARHD